MTFWTDNRFEPKRNFRFKVTFKGVSEKREIKYFYISQVQKPSFTISVKKVKHINTDVNYPTNKKWNPITITFIDDTNNTVMSILRSLYSRNNSINRNPGNFYNFDTSTEGLLLETITIVQTDEDGRLVEQWDLYNPILSDLSQDALDYNNEDLSKITLTINYDWADLSFEDDATREKREADELKQEMKQLEAMFQAEQNPAQQTAGTGIPNPLTSQQENIVTPQPSGTNIKRRPADNSLAPTTPTRGSSDGSVSLDEKPNMGPKNKYKPATNPLE